MRAIRGATKVLVLVVVVGGCGAHEEARERGERRFAEVERRYLAVIEERLRPAPTPPSAAPSADLGDREPPPEVPAAAVSLEAAPATSSGPAVPVPPPGAVAPPIAPMVPPAATATAATAPGTFPQAQPTPTYTTRAAAPQGLATGGPTPRSMPMDLGSPPSGGDPTPRSAAPAPAQAPAVNPEPTPDEPPGSDAEPPMLRGLRFEPAEAPDGSEVAVVVETADNLSGVASASGSLSSPSRKIYIPFSLALAGGDGATLSGRFQIPPRSEAGAWTMSSLRLTDKAHNTVVLSPRDHPVVAGARLSVFSAGTDTVAPRLDAIEVSPQADDGGVVTIKLRVVDDDSAVGSVRGILANPSRSVQLNFYPRLNAESGLYEGTVSLPKHSEYGDWQVTLLTLTDSANNRATLTLESDEKLKAARVNVSSSTSDTSSPQLQSIELIPSRVVDGGSVELVIGATDDLSGVKGIDGWMVSPNKSARIHFSLRASEPGMYRGTLKVPAKAANGVWIMERLALADQAGNRAVLGATDPQLQGAVFEVYAGP